MRRSAYNSLNNSEETDEVDKGEMRVDDLEDETLFSEINRKDASANKRTICLVFTLFFVGLITLVTSTLILLGHLDSEVYADRMIPLMILGSLMFIPGSYYFRIVYKTSRGVPGFSYDQIPSCY